MGSGEDFRHRLFPTAVSVLSIRRQRGGSLGSRVPLSDAKVRRRFGNRPPIGRRAMADADRVNSVGSRRIVAFATDYLSHQLPAMASLTHDLLDGYADLRQSQDSRIGLLAAQIALILEALGRGEQFRIDCRRPDRAADLAHRFADGIEEGPTGVLHQMPTICDLYRVRQRLCRGFAISSAAVTGYDRDRGMSSEPGLRGRGLTIRQQRDDSASFQVADDAGVSMIAPPGPIINADNPERISRRTATASDHAKERILAHW